MCFECFVEVTELLTRITVFRFDFTGTITYLLSLALWLASRFVIRLLVSALFVICHPC